MLAVVLEKAVSWQVTENSVSAGFPTQGGSARLPSADDQRLLAQLAGEILGRAVTFRVTQVDAAPAEAAPARPAAAAAAASSGVTIMGHPEVAEFLRQFPGATVEEPKRR